MSASSVRELARHWTGRLVHYRGHQNSEHLEALLAEALRFVGFQLENDLTHSSYWTGVPLSRRASLLLFLVDRGVINRINRSARVAYEAEPDAVHWVLSQPSLVPYLVPTLEFVSAVQADQSRRSSSPQA